MPTDRQLEQTISRWLEAEAPGQLPDRVMRATFERTRKTRQQATWQALLRRLQVNRMFAALGSVAAVVVVALVAVGLYFNQPGGFGGVPPTPTQAPSPTAAPTAAPSPTVPPSPTASPRPATDGNLQPGTYIVDPLQVAGNPLTVTFTVPEGWAVIGGSGVYSADEPGSGPPGGIAIGFEDITSLNGDPCDWSGSADDVSVGTTVDDLVEALGAQMAYEVSEPVDVTIGGYSGKRVDIIHPTEPFTGPDDSDAPGCDEGVYRIWSSAVHGPYTLYAQGPAHRWQANILDVDGTRLVVVALDFPATAAEDRAEMDAIIDSFVIEP